MGRDDGLRLSKCAAAGSLLAACQPPASCHCSLLHSWAPDRICVRVRVSNDLFHGACMAPWFTTHNFRGLATAATLSKSAAGVPRAQAPAIDACAFAWLACRTGPSRGQVAVHSRITRRHRHHHHHPCSCHTGANTNINTTNNNNKMHTHRSLRTFLPCSVCRTGCPRRRLGLSIVP